MRNQSISMKALGLVLLLALLLALGLTALAEEPPISGTKFSHVLTPQDDVWVEIPKDANAASWDVSLWDIRDGREWKLLFIKDRITTAGKVTLETAGKLSEGVYALRVVQYDAKDREQEYWQRVVTVFDQLPASGTVTLSLSNTKGSTGSANGVTVYAPEATSVLLVHGSNRIEVKGDYLGVAFSHDTDEKMEVYAIATYPNGTTRVSQKKTITFSEEGSLGEWKVTGMPSGSVAQSAGVSMHIPRVTNADKVLSNGKNNIYYEVVVWDTDADSRVFQKTYKEKKDPDDRSSAPLIGSGVDVKLGSDDFTAGHNYVCFMQATSYGFGYIYQQAMFKVSGGADEKLTLSVNDKTSGALKMDCGEEFTVRVTIPSGATAVRVYCGDHFEYMNKWGEWDRWSREGEIEFGWSLWDKTSYPFYAQAYYKALSEDQDLRALKWGAASSNVVSVSAKNSTRLPAPVFKLSADSVARGEVVTATITDMGEGAEGVNAEVYGQDVEGEYHDFRQSGKTIRIPTAAMEPGVYVVNVSNYAQGRWGSSAYAAFRVTAPAAADKPVIGLSHTKLPTHQQQRVTAYAEGARHIDVIIRRGKDREDERGVDGDTFDDWMGGWGEPDEYTVVVRADYGKSTVEATASFTVVGSKGTLKDPVIKDAPSQSKVGEPVTIKYTPDSKTGWTYIDLHRIEDDGEWIHIFGDDIDGKATSYTFVGDCFDKPGTYRIGIHPNQEGYASGHAEIFFQVVKKAQKETVTLTVNGGKKAVTLESEERLAFEVNAPDATALRVLDENGNWQYWLRDDHPSHVIDQRSYDGGRTFTMVAQACYDDYNPDKAGFSPEKLKWSGVSNAITVTVKASNGVLNRPEASLSASSVRRDGKLTVTVTPQKVSKGTVKHFVDIERKVSDDDWEWLYHVEMDTATSIALPVNVLEPGDYCAVVHAYGEGFRGSEKALPFAVTKPSDTLKKVQLTLNRTKVKTCEEVRAYVSADGADRVEIKVVMKEDPDWEDYRDDDGDRVDHGFMFTRKGNYIFTPYGHINGKRVAGDPVTVTVTASGSAVIPELTVPPVMLLGQPLKAPFKKVSGTREYYTDLHYVPWDGDWEWRGGWDIIDGSTVLNYGAECFDRAGIYTVKVEARVVGKQTEESRVFFAVVDPEKILRLPGGLKTIGEEAFAGSPAQMIVVPEGVTQIGRRAFADCPNLLAVIIPDSVKKVDESAFDGSFEGMIQANKW